MSFLISFNGQFSPYVHPTQDPWQGKVTPVQPLEQMDTTAVDHHAPDTKTMHHPPSQQIKSYQQAVKSFEQTKKRVYARDIMSSPVHSVKKIAQVSEAIAIMKKFGFRHLPVFDGNESLVGLLSDRELLSAKPHSTCEDLMVSKVVVGLQQARVQEIAHIMLQEKINALPIINDQHVVVGIITQSDILKFVIGSEAFSSLG